MRMGGDGPSAADVVNAFGETCLADVIRRFGEERRARAVARAIVAARREAPVTSTARLAAIVRAAVGRTPGGIDPATRTFQALRIWTNDEIAELERGLIAAEEVLGAGGRLVVVAFHSLEDRAVKTFLRERSAVGANRHMPAVSRPATFRPLSGRVVRPDAGEVAANPRARSARMRAAVRTAEPAWRAGA